MAWQRQRLRNGWRKSAAPRRNSTAVWCGRMGCRLCLGSPIGCTGFTNKGGFRRSLRRRHGRISKSCWRPWGSLFSRHRVCGRCAPGKARSRSVPGGSIVGGSYALPVHRGGRRRRRNRRGASRGDEEHRRGASRPAPGCGCGREVARSPRGVSTSCSATASRRRSGL